MTAPVVAVDVGGTGVRASTADATLVAAGELALDRAAVSAR